MDCVECPEGYRVTYTPMAPGNYLISIKYGGPYHIGGSPFKAKITGEEDFELPQINCGITSKINTLFSVFQVPSSCPATVCTKPLLLWLTLWPVPSAVLNRLLPPNQTPARWWPRARAWPRALLVRRTASVLTAAKLVSMIVTEKCKTFNMSSNLKEIMTQRKITFKQNKIYIRLILLNELFALFNKTLQWITWCKWNKLQSLGTNMSGSSENLNIHFHCIAVCSAICWMLARAFNHKVVAVHTNSQSS